MRNPGKQSWLALAVAAPLALLFATAGMADPPDKKARLETLFLGAGGDEDLVWLEEGQVAFFGVQVEEETEYAEGGARVTNVVHDSPAEKAGVKEGDIIVSFGGETVRGPVALTTKIHAREPGDAVKLVVVREGKKVPLEAELGDRGKSGVMTYKMFIPEGFPESVVIPGLDLERYEQLKENLEKAKERYTELYSCEDEDCDIQFFGGFAGKPMLGVQLVETTPELRKHLGGSEDAGVLVSKVLSGTPAREAGIKVGDLIVEVDGEKVESSSGIRKQLHGKRGEQVRIAVIRNGERMSIEVEIPKTDEDVPTGPRVALPAQPDWGLVLV